jgi:hypothetical protein
MLEGSCATPSMWDLDQARKVIDYFDARWHLLPLVRDAWTDARVLKLDEDLVPSTASSEGSHRWWDEHMLGNLHNRDVLSVLMKTIGITANGDFMRRRPCAHNSVHLLFPPVPTPRLSCCSYFSDAEKRFRAQRETKESPGERLCEAKACWAFFAHDPSDWIEFIDDDTAFVRPLGDDCLRRHAEASSAVRPFPPQLKAMLRAVVHGGPLSFTREGWYAVDLRTKRCECLASTYHGVRSARGPCKHWRLVALELAARESELAREVVCADALEKLCLLVRRREGHKPLLTRCGPLYTAAMFDEDPEHVIEALARHKSIPPTGKSTGLDDVPAPSPEGYVEDGGALAVRMRVTFATCDNLGVRLILPDADDEEAELISGELLVHSFTGPRLPEHTGDRLRPGDLIMGADRLDELRVTPDGLLDVKGLAPGPLTLEFVRRPPRRAAASDEEAEPASLAGRPARRRAKTSHSSPGRGGAPKRKGAKPQPLRASERKQVRVPEGSTHEQAEAMLAQLLSPDSLTELQTKLLAELAEMTYIA